MSEIERLAKAFRKWQSENMGKDIALSLVPGVGQIYGMGSALAAYADPDASNLDRGLQSLSFVPFGSLAKLRNANKIVAGEHGAGAIPPAIDELDHAKDLYDNSIYPTHPQLTQQIFRETGWWKDPTSQRWMREFGDEFSNPDYGIFERATSRSGLTSRVLEDTVDHPELFRLYPQLRGYKNILNPRKPVDTGHFNSAGQRIAQGAANFDPNNARQLSAIRDTQLHEIQHAIADIEGFALGSSPASSGSYEAYLRDPGEILARVAALRRNLTTEARQKLPFYRHMMEEEGRLMQPGESSRYATMEEMKRLLGSRNLEWQEMMYPSP